MRWYLGELSNTDIATANYLKPQVDARLRSPGTGTTSPPLLDADAISSRLAALDSRLNDGTQLTPPPLGVGAQRLADWAESATRQKYGPAALGTGNSGIDGRLIAARGSPVESQLVTGPYLNLAGLDPGAQPNDTGINMASPLRGNFAQFLSTSSNSGKSG